MFTGLIREMATVKHYDGATLTLKADYRPKLGDSVAVNGACLSVVALASDGFSVELSPETRALIATERLEGVVHIEPAMQLGERIEGHLVQGHVDTVGTVLSVTDSGNSYDVIIQVDPEVIALIAPKGSIAIDGVSLTVNTVMHDRFRLTIIPITMRETLFARYRPGTRVNVETDMFARYIAHFLRPQGKDTLDWETATRFTAMY